ncbi:MAG: glycosyltransferase [Chloroflexi bacterium]|nr:glycosyltransferase [Chloroflexota bacterium]
MEITAANNKRSDGLAIYKMKLDKTRRPRSGATDKLTVVYVSTFPPRVCGIATFTEDLTHAMDEMLAPMLTSRIVAMSRSGVLGYRYPRKVFLQINQDNQEEYTETALRINRMDEVQLVNIQHEFGIFGGGRGAHLIPFVQALRKPLVITFHTVLPDPDEELYNVVRSLAESASAIIVMTDLSKGILAQQYAIPQKKIKVIPHGIPSQPYTSSQQAKRTLGYSDRVVLSTFGLINRDKGLEYVIEALPQVIRQYPNFVYIIFGATHPEVLRNEGESYRNFLIEKVYGLGLYDHVKLYNRYFPLSELLHFLKATDIYISSSLEPKQAVSGTLSYALGMGRPVISTAFAQAREVVTGEVGIVVDFRNSQAYADAILRLLEDEKLRLQLGENAYFRTRNMTWANVALQYARVFSEYAPGLAHISEQKSLPRIKLNHLIHLTDTFGIVQFANLTRRDVSSGYTLDDNARALAVTALYWGKLGSSAEDPSVAKQKRELLKLVNTYLGFISFVAQSDGLFQNFVNSDGTLDNVSNQRVDLEEANARAIYALALTATTASLPKTIRQRAFDLLQKRLRSGIFFNSPRAIARCIKAFCILLDGKGHIEGIDLKGTLRSYCDRLVELYQAVSQADWQWFETYLTYSNGVMPEALLLGYRALRDERYLTVGKATLDFLIKQSFVNGIYVPIGQDGWYHQNGKHHHFDQQPEEVNSMVDALSTGYAVAGDEEYSGLMYQAFYWFLGDNTFKQLVYDRTTGGCYDGVGKTTINLNQGAESTVSYLLARLVIG